MKFKKFLPLVIAAVMLVGVQFVMQPVGDISADATTNYYRTTIEEDEVYSAGTDYSTVFDTESYGQVVIQAAQDVTSTGSVTYTLQWSNDSTDCSLVSNWFTGTQYYIVENPAYRYIASTTAITSAGTLTGTEQTVTTYSYTSVAASVTSVALEQGWVQAGDITEGHTFEVLGLCGRLSVEAGETSTVTLELLDRDQYE